MKILVAAFIPVALAQAFNPKPCEELKSEIAAKLDANGVKNYVLEIVPASEVRDQTVVGSCETGSKKITYKKDAGAPAEKPADKR